MADTRACTLCEKVFANKQGLEYHTTNGVCQKRVCSHCGVRFKTSSGLAYHETSRKCMPKEKIPVKVTRKYDYHSYVLPRSSIDLTEVIQSVGEEDFGNRVFGDNRKNIITAFCELALANDKLDQYWSYSIGGRRDQFIYVYNDEEWKLQPLRTACEEIMMWALDTLEQYLNNLGQTEESNVYWTKYYFTRDHLDEPKHSIHREVRQDLLCMFVNLRPKMKAKFESTGCAYKP